MIEFMIEKAKVEPIVHMGFDENKITFTKPSMGGQIPPAEGSTSPEYPIWEFNADFGGIIHIYQE